jgi:hypothetical protein
MRAWPVHNVKLALRLEAGGNLDPGGSMHNIWLTALALAVAALLPPDGASAAPFRSSAKAAQAAVDPAALACGRWSFCGPRRCMARRMCGRRQ